MNASLLARTVGDYLRENRDKFTDASIVKNLLEHMAAILRLYVQRENGRRRKPMPGGKFV